MKRTTIALAGLEPVIDVKLEVTAAYAKALRDAKFPVPSPVKAKALIDTGFTGTLMVDEELIRPLNLKTRGWSRIGFTREDARFYQSACYAWDVDIAVRFPACAHNGADLVIDTSATRVEFINSPNCQLLIGTKILQMALFVYNGQKSHFTLGFPK